MWSESMSLNSMTRVVMRKKVMIQFMSQCTDHKPISTHLISSLQIELSQSKDLIIFEIFFFFFQFPSSKTSLHTKITNAGDRLYHLPWERKGQEDVTK